MANTFELLVPELEDKLRLCELSVADSRVKVVFAEKSVNEKNRQVCPQGAYFMEEC